MGCSFFFLDDYVDVCYTDTSCISILRHNFIFLADHHLSANLLFHIPETIGSVVAAYNLPIEGLKLTGPILADIFLGKITKWNDPKIQSINSGLSLPAEDIVVVHRSDGSRTTFVWTDYLSNVSSAWEQQIGKGKSVQWPIGVGAPGNEGVANSINTTPNAIGYVELTYAITTGMKHASVQNEAGNFIQGSLDSTRAAVAAAAPSLPAGEI